jgi:hypothetical protein
MLSLTIQKSWRSPLLSVKFFREEMAKIEGAISLGFVRPSQGECQKLAIRRSLMVMADDVLL